jgi:hypothetical protein
MSRMQLRLEQLRAQAAEHIKRGSVDKVWLLILGMGCYMQARSLTTRVALATRIKLVYSLPGCSGPSSTSRESCAWHGMTPCAAYGHRLCCVESVQQCQCAGDVHCCRCCGIRSEVQTH